MWCSSHSTHTMIVEMGGMIDGRNREEEFQLNIEHYINLILFMLSLCPFLLPMVEIVILKATLFVNGKMITLDEQRSSGSYGLEKPQPT